MTEPFYTDPLVTLLLGDCVARMAELPDASVDAVVTDPPYGLEFMGKEWDRLGATVERNDHEDDPFAAQRGGSLPFGGGGQRVRYGASAKSMQAWHEQWATEAFRVLKPGGYLLAFGGTRTVHRLACAIEDAGFEIRDELVWVYASGFPKSLDVSKAMDRAAGAEREVVGLHPAPAANKPGGACYHMSERGMPDEATITAPATDLARQWEGWGTALKPAHEPIVMARKPLQGTVAGNVAKYGTGALNIDGTRIPGAVNGWEEPRGGIWTTDSDAKAELTRREGRWPSNILLSDPELFDQENPWVVGSGATTQSRASDYDWADSGNDNPTRVAHNIKSGVHFEDAGGYSRFFIISKADRAERERGLADRAKRPSGAFEDDNYRQPGERKANHTAPMPRANVHPTVKPIDLMRHLVRLVTPPGGVVLDPFLGSGTTALAASEEGFRCIGIEREADYLAIAKARLMATDIGLGLDTVLRSTRAPSKGHWPNARTAGRDGWGFSGQLGLDERFSEDTG